VSAVALDLVDATPTAMVFSRLGVAAFPGGGGPAQILLFPTYLCAE
jgi:hypothetical protein